jgi:hypothetical protein
MQLKIVIPSLFLCIMLYPSFTQGSDQSADDLDQWLTFRVAVLQNDSISVYNLLQEKNPPWPGLLFEGLSICAKEGNIPMATLLLSQTQIGLILQSPERCDTELLGYLNSAALYSLVQLSALKGNSDFLTWLLNFQILPSPSKLVTFDGPYDRSNLEHLKKSIEGRMSSSKGNLPERYRKTLSIVQSIHLK